MKKIVIISDVHGKWNKLIIPPCDVLISCGDYSFHGEKNMIKDFHSWLDEQEANYIISVQGNHEVFVEKHFEEAKAIAIDACPRINFIEEGLVEIEGIKIWCSAITPHFHNWAYNRWPGENIEAHWRRIPDDIDILVTHGPPHGILDKTPRGNNAGCPSLLKRILELPKCKYHFFGHIHNDYGYKYFEGKQFYNTSICGETYMADNNPTIIDYE